VLVFAQALPNVMQLILGEVIERNRLRVSTMPKERRQAAQQRRGLVMPAKQGKQVTQ
jgi:hypothetical protein